MKRATHLVLVLLIAGARIRAEPPAPLLDEALVHAAYEKLKALEGEWNGQSTKGWTDRATVRAIAGGSAVLHTSFDAHPNETMATLIHLDGPRLLLTHYCVAKNQPRLVATEIADDGRSMTFEFLDGTNMTSRNVGHMDRVVFRFVDEDNYTSRWMWYQDGKETWTEEIRSTRVKPQTDVSGRP